MKCIKLLLLILSLGFMFSCTNENIELSDYNINLKIGEEKEIEAFYDKNKEIIWESENPNIAIANEGKITGVSAGNTNVLVYLKDNKETSVKLTVSVTENIYNISYNLDGGQCEGLVYLFKDNEEVILPIPVKTGYTFIGWYEENNENSIKVENIENRNYNLIAKYEINKKVITFDSDDGIMNSYILEFESDEEVVLPVPVKDGFEFLGWYEDGNKVENITNRDYNLKAKWSAKIYTIKYNLKGGTCDNLLEDFVYSDDVVLPIPKRDGFKFLGWFESYELEEVIGENLEPRDYSLIAKWEKEVYKVTYNLDGGTADGLVTEFSYPNKPILPSASKEGYIFLGWYSNSNLYEIGDKLGYENYALKAYFVKEYTPYEVFDSVYPLPTNLTFAPKLTNFSYGILEATNSLNDEIYLNIGFGNLNNLKYKYVKFILNISEGPTISLLEDYTIIKEINDFDNGWFYQCESLPIVQDEQQLLNPYAEKFIYKLNNNDFVNDTGYINIIMLISNSEEISDTLSNHEEYRVRQVKYVMDKNDGTITFKKYNYFTS